MKTKPLVKLKKEYQSCCNEYLKKFCNKQDFDFKSGFWVGNDIGGVFFVSDFYFNLYDIVWDINSQQEKGLIIQWYDDFAGYMTTSINYYAYTKGVRNNQI